MKWEILIVIPGGAQKTFATQGLLTCRVVSFGKRHQQKIGIINELKAFLHVWDVYLFTYINVIEFWDSNTNLC